METQEYSEKTGNTYQGQMKMMKNKDGIEIMVHHGKGIQTWPDGSKYEGYWHEGRMHGYGRLIKANQGVYEGEFKADKADGKGMYTYYSGDSYEG